MEHLFDDLRPYYDSEIPAAMQRIAAHEFFLPVSQFLFPNVSVSDFRKRIGSIQTAHQLQVEVMHPIIRSIVAKTTEGFTFSGAEHLLRHKGMLFVSNHRDIVLDAFLTQYMLYINSFPTSEITFGSNLMMNPFVIDVGRANKMFKVERKGDNLREFLRHSKHLSQYIRYTLTQKNTSVWIAQRNGRTKDGWDSTDQGLLKMFGLSGGPHLPEAFEELHIVPLAISYELEPCDFLKVKELYASRDGSKYVKGKNEDFTSIVTGLTQAKGHVHLSVCPPIGREELEALAVAGPQDFYKSLAALIDRRILSAYKLYPNNYVAYDMLHGTSQYAQKYTPSQVSQFASMIDKQMELLEGDREVLRTLFLRMYANPVGRV